MHKIALLLLSLYSAVSFAGEPEKPITFTIDYFKNELALRAFRQTITERVPETIKLDLFPNTTIKSVSDQLTLITKSPGTLHTLATGELKDPDKTLQALATSHYWFQGDMQDFSFNGLYWIGSSKHQ